ncbi:calcium-binding protein, partial [Xanthobacter autotrophicus]|uniref:calcium-binding protein n=1 Tax=Xanthobacter autotrophicus TaxID=280 RepID=UPI00372B4B47
GRGDDTYIVDNVGDVIYENAGEGTDQVNATVTYRLAGNVENLTLLGSAAINGTGNELDNTLIGNDAVNALSGYGGDDLLYGRGGADVIYGGDGDDLLDGGSGADLMYGGAGNDTYVVDDAKDSAIESAGQGTDTVRASVSFTLAVNVENLTLTGASAINGTGNTLANVIVGNGADNILTGGRGTDTLTGGEGADRFVFTALSDFGPMSA